MLRSSLSDRTASVERCSRLGTVLLVFGTGAMESATVESKAGGAVLLARGRND